MYYAVRIVVALGQESWFYLKMFGLPQWPDLRHNNIVTFYKQNYNIHKVVL